MVDDGQFNNLIVYNELKIGAEDTKLYRSAPNVLTTNDQFIVDFATDISVRVGTPESGLIQGIHCNPSAAYLISGWKSTSGAIESNPLVVIHADGKIKWGAGGESATDVDLYRAEPNVLATDDVIRSDAHNDDVEGGEIQLASPLGWDSPSSAKPRWVIDAYSGTLRLRSYDGSVNWLGLTLDYPNDRITLPSTTDLYFGTDVNLHRSDANTLSITESDGSTPAKLTLNSTLIANDVAQIQVTSGTNARMLPTQWYPNPTRGYTDLGHGNILFKHTGSQHDYPDDKYTSLFLVMVQDPNQLYSNKYYPILATDHGLWVEKDIQTYGALFTNSDPGKSSGGGAILMGHGFTGATADPEIRLMDTVGGGSGAEATLTVSGGVITAVNVTSQGSGYAFADITVNGTGSDARLAPVIVNGAIQSINVYDGGSGYSGSDTVSITNNPHDVLYLKKFDGSTPAHLDLGDLTAHGHLSVGDTVASDLNPNSNLTLGNLTNRWLTLVVETAKVNDIDPIPAQYGGNGTWIDVNTKLRINVDLQLNNGHVVSSLNPSGSVALGSPQEPWAGIVATEGYFEYIETDDFNWYDTLDDLALLKNCRRKRVKLPDSATEVDVIDVNSLDLLRADKLGSKSAWNLNKTIGFLFGVARQHLMRTEELEQKQAALLKRITVLENLKDTN